MILKIIVFSIIGLIAVAYLLHVIFTDRDREGE